VLAGDAIAASEFTASQERPDIVRVGTPVNGEEDHEGA